MSDRCAVCSNYTFRDLPKGSVAAGLGICAKGPKWQFPNPYMVRNCIYFAQVPADQLAARIEWEQKA